MTECDNWACEEEPDVFDVTVHYPQGDVEGDFCEEHYQNGTDEGVFSGGERR